MTEDEVHDEIFRLAMRLRDEFDPGIVGAKMAAIGCSVLKAALGREAVVALLLQKAADYAAEPTEET